MNKVFPTSRVCAWWAFKVALHRTCVLLLVHEWLEHALQSLSGGGGGGDGGGQGWQEQPRVTALSLSCTGGLGVSICCLLCPWVLLNPALCFWLCHCSHGYRLYSQTYKLKNRMQQLYLEENSTRPVEVSRFFNAQYFQPCRIRWVNSCLSSGNFPNTHTRE